MSPFHVALALVVVVIWALNFVVVTVGLHSIPPFLLLTLRFLVAGLPVVFLRRPTVPWARLIAIAVTLFIVQFGFLFSGMARGMAAGMAAIVLQSQVPFTVFLSVVVLKERPTVRQTIGIVIALSGLTLIGLTAGTGGVSGAGIVLTLCAAMGWSGGNILLRGAGRQNVLAMMVWLSAISVPPFLGLSLGLEGGLNAIVHTLSGMTWTAFGVVLYIAIGSTLIGYGIWGYLLRHYSATTVAPFVLLVPVLAAAAASLLLGEQFDRMRVLGMAIILAGIAAIVLPARRPTPAAVAARAGAERGGS